MRSPRPLAVICAVAASAVIGGVVILCTALAAAGLPSPAQASPAQSSPAQAAAAQAPPSLAFTVTPRPSRHEFHVVLRCAHLRGEMQDFEMPAWMPGFYRILHYARHVSRFQARDGQGRRLGWEQVTPHTWRVVTGHAPIVILSYDVAATRPFVADNSISTTSAFLAPPGTFLYLPGQLALPATVTFHLPPSWRRISSGLAPVAGRPRTFTASNFNLLFDSPVLMGNQQILHFRVRGRPHTIAMEYVPASVPRGKIVRDLRRIVEAGTTLMRTIPYPRYTFLLIGRGDGGIEHLTSAAISFNGRDLTTPAGYRTWLSYVAHEYFHTFNVKRIRPLALGPFDYETENLTHMLWVSEGLEVYYEDLLLVRAGLITPAQYLATLQHEINVFENEPGRPYESATESSWYTWTSSYGGRGGAAGRNITISYYDNGAMLGAMLDLAIRHDSHNAHSLGTVMRALYRDYFLRDRRGFTDAEFRAACERAAGRSLAPIFRYAATTAPMNYRKYFGYAGIRVAVRSAPAAGATLGLDTDADAGGLVVSGVRPGSPAARAAIRRGDQLLTLEGTPASARALSRLLASHQPGQTVTVTLRHDGVRRSVWLTLAGRRKWTYSLRRGAHPDPLQAATLRRWLRRTVLASR